MANWRRGCISWGSINCQFNLPTCHRPSPRSIARSLWLMWFQRGDSLGLRYIDLCVYKIRRRGSPWLFVALFECNAITRLVLAGVGWLPLCLLAAGVSASVDLGHVAVHCIIIPLSIYNLRHPTREWLTTHANYNYETIIKCGIPLLKLSQRHSGIPSPSASLLLWLLKS